jgi:polyadenylate-binding protein
MSAQFSRAVIQDLPPTASEEYVKILISERVPPSHLKGLVIKRKNHAQGQPITYAFVTLETKQDVDALISHLNYTKLDGVPIHIMSSDIETRKIVHSRKGRLFVMGFDPSIEDSQVHNAFENFGEVIVCKMVMNEEGISLGYGYVQFRREEDATTALNDLKNASINGWPLTLKPFKRGRVDLFD